MDIGLELLITVKKEKTHEEQTYTCTIIDQTDDFIYIDQPIHTETHRTSVLSRGSHIEVSFIGKDHVVYAYESIVIHRKLLTIPAYAILPPKENEMNRIQRRNFVRVQASIDVAIDCVNQTIEPFTTVTKDISGGGLACIMPVPNFLEKNQCINVYLVLPTTSPTFIQAKARVVKIHLKNEAHPIVSMEFIQLSPADQQSMIRYVFSIQRKQLEKYM